MDSVYFCIHTYNIICKEEVGGGAGGKVLIFKTVLTSLMYDVIPSLSSNIIYFEYLNYYTTKLFTVNKV